MVEAAICFDIARERGGERLSGRRDPVDNDTFQAFGVVGSCTRDTFLNLDNGKGSWLAVIRR